MRDSLGGTVSLVIIIIFIVFGLGYLAYSVNYTKAFRMKDKIISLFNENNGFCDRDCQDSIIQYANEIGYSTDNTLKCPDSNEQGIYGLFCATYHSILQNKSDIPGDIKEKGYYQIITKINLQIPVVSNIIDFDFFYISGDTKTYTKG